MGGVGKNQPEKPGATLVIASLWPYNIKQRRLVRLVWRAGATTERQSRYSNRRAGGNECAGFFLTWGRGKKGQYAGPVQQDFQTESALTYCVKKRERVTQVTPGNGRGTFGKQWGRRFPGRNSPVWNSANVERHWR